MSEADEDGRMAQWSAVKYGVELQFSCCMLTEATGQNHCNHPIPATPRVSWYRRLRWDVAAWWYDHAPRLHFGPCDHGDCS